MKWLRTPSPLVAATLSLVLLIAALVVMSIWSESREVAYHTIDRTWGNEPGVILHKVCIRTSRERAELIRSRLEEAMPCANDREFLGVPRLHLMLHSFGYDDTDMSGKAVNRGRITVTFVEEPDDRLVGKYPYYYFEWLLDDFPVPDA
jgi:hypothetical protein